MSEFEKSIRELDFTFLDVDAGIQDWENQESNLILSVFSDRVELSKLDDTEELQLIIQVPMFLALVVLRAYFTK